jgi:mRNA-degrading endonuclease toxin of MazEF toxin-antitoxin module
METKRFLEWIKLKERLHFNSKNFPLFNNGEIWWVSMGENINHEINGKGKDFCRPVLVYRKLSRTTFLGLPITTKDKKGTWYVAIKQSEKNANVILSQVRVFDSKRMLNRIGTIDEEDLIKVKTGFLSLFS